MYEHFYGLKENPFSLTPDPHYLYLGENHREALAQLIYGVRQKKGFIVLTGEVGTGKTTIIRSFMETLNGSQSNTRVALLFNPRLSVNEFFQYILKDFGINSNGATKGEYLHALYEYLIDAYQKDEKVVLIIDEAQGLSKELLEEIRLLSNLETSKAKLLQIVLVGQPELGHTLLQDELRQLRQRVNLQHHLPPLSESETGGYIRKRLRIAGCRNPIFTPQAIKEIYKYTGGVPRLINVLCDNALLTGYALESKIISPKIIRDVANDLKLTPKKWPWLKWSLGFLIIGGVILFVESQETKVLSEFGQFIKEIINNFIQSISIYFS
ncbi:MAG: ExeA family protein [bacterium]